MFGLLIPSTIVESFKGTDVNSKSPPVQAGNLEAIVGAETPKDHQAVGLQRVISSMAPAHTQDEDAAAVFAGAMTEVHRPLSSADLALLAKSKIPARQSVAELYANPAPPRTRAKTLADALPRDRFLYKLARAQTLEGLGDRSVRREVSPALDPTAPKSAEMALGALLWLAFLLGCVAIVGYLSALATGTIKWRGHPVEPESKPDADRLAIRAAQFFGVFLGVELLVAVFADSLPALKSPGGLLLAEVCSSVAIIVGTVLVTRVSIGGRSLSLVDYGLTKEAIFPALLWGVGGLLAVVPLATVGMLLGSLLERFAPRADHPLTHMLEDPHNLLLVAGTFFLASVQAPFTEELLFRGTLTPALSGLFRGSRYAVPLAIGVSSLIFASIHPQGFTLWLPLASVGVVNAVLCYQTRSVLPGMVMHALFNAFALVATLLIR